LVGEAFGGILEGGREGDACMIYTFLVASMGREGGRDGRGKEMGLLDI